MGQIYKIFNDINSKLYIGKTTKNSEHRFKEHLSQINDGTAIHNAMKKYGIDKFHIEILEDNIFDNQILAEREKYWILKLNSQTPNGYNIASGGEGGNGTHAKNLIQWRIDNPQLAQKNIDILQNWIKDNPDKVKENNLKGAKTRKEKYGKAITKEANEASKKAVKCLETGIIYDSVKEAALALGHTSGAHIGQVCNGQRKTAFKYHWSWQV